MFIHSCAHSTCRCGEPLGQAPLQDSVTSRLLLVSSGVQTRVNDSNSVQNYALYTPTPLSRWSLHLRLPDQMEAPVNFPEGTLQHSTEPSTLRMELCSTAQSPLTS